MRIKGRKEREQQREVDSFGFGMLVTPDDPGTSITLIICLISDGHPKASQSPVKM